MGRTSASTPGERHEPTGDRVERRSIDHRRRRVSNELSQGVQPRRAGRRITDRFAANGDILADAWLFNGTWLAGVGPTGGLYEYAAASGAVPMLPPRSTPRARVGGKNSAVRRRRSWAQTPSCRRVSPPAILTGVRGYSVTGGLPFGAAASGGGGAGGRRSVASLQQRRSRLGPVALTARRPSGEPADLATNTPRPAASFVGPTPAATSDPSARRATSWATAFVTPRWHRSGSGQFLLQQHGSRISLAGRIQMRFAGGVIDPRSKGLTPSNTASGSADAIRLRRLVAGDRYLVLQRHHHAARGSDRLHLFEGHPRWATAR
jgi:hypothetical protein